MAANMGDRVIEGDNMTEVNLQADGLVEEPAHQRAVDLRGMEGEDSSPYNLPTWSPCREGCLQAISI